jgi:hypothetical protein
MLERRGSTGWPSGQRDDTGHTEESDVREARPPTLELIVARKKRPERYLNARGNEGTFLHVSGWFQRNCVLTGYCHRDTRNGQ